MKTLAIVFCYRRSRVLALCARTILERTDELPEAIYFIDDGRTVQEVIDNLQTRTSIHYIGKPSHLGFSDSAVSAIKLARLMNPDFIFLIEGDYIFRQWGLDTVLDVLENTEQGRHCLGISGYDNPCYYRDEMIREVFPAGMLHQMGEDNVNRHALHRPVGVAGKRFAVTVELVSNTCFSCYLNWRRIQELAAEFPELNDYIDQACSPRENPDYPTSGEYKARGVVDDGMLSHGISLVWNRWAIKHGIDREKFGAWLNIIPSVANHIAGGGLNNGGLELETNASSPSWLS